MRRHTWKPPNARSPITVSDTDGCLSASRPWDLGEAIEEILRLAAERARIRRELLKVWVSEQRLAPFGRVIAEEDFRAAIDAIIPEEGRTVILTQDEEAWCAWMKDLEVAGVRPDVAVHSASLAAFTAGASRERIRVGNRLRIEIRLSLSGHKSAAGGGVAEALEIAEHSVLAALDRICGTESTEGGEHE